MVEQWTSTSSSESSAPDVLAKAAEVNLAGDAEDIGLPRQRLRVVVLAEQRAPDDSGACGLASKGLGERLEEDVLALPGRDSPEDSDREHV
jgi:hypothetical protein